MKKKTKTKKVKKTHGMPSGNGPRGLWKGSISFGLVNIPVSLFSAEQEKKIHFSMLDKRDKAPVGYKQINKKTGKEILKVNIIKAYEYKKGEYALMDEAEIKKAHPKALSNIEIEDFITLEEVDFLFFEKPYYIIPQNGAEKGYVLLRDVLEKTKKVAIAKVVMHTVQHLVSIIPREDYLILEIMRFSDEIKEVKEAGLLGNKIAHIKATSREMQVATQLVEDMTSKWNPEKYKSTFREELLKLVKAKVKKGATTEVEKVETQDDAETASNVIDLAALLQKSLKKKQVSHAHH